MNINIIQGSLLDADTDTIVNPANSFLRHGGGLAHIIERAAIGAIATPGQPDFPYSEAVALWNTDHAKAPLIATGGAHWTSAGCMPFEGIVHAVGPIWGGGSYYEASLLRSAHARALRVAADHGCTSIAFPAISCGVFGYPVDQAAFVAIPTVRDWLELQDMGAHAVIDRVDFYLFEDAHVEAYNAALAASS